MNEDQKRVVTQLAREMLKELEQYKIVSGVLGVTDRLLVFDTWYTLRLIRNNVAMEDTEDTFAEQTYKLKIATERLVFGNVRGRN